MPGICQAKWTYYSEIKPYVCLVLLTIKITYYLSYDTKHDHTGHSHGQSNGFPEVTTRTFTNTLSSSSSAALPCSHTQMPMCSVRSGLVGQEIQRERDKEAGCSVQCAHKQ